MNLSLDQIIADLKQQPANSEKTASAKEPAVETKSAAAKTELMDALKRAGDAASTKTASDKTQSTPVADLEKVASDLAAADVEMLTKEAQFYGAAICDGFMARLKQYEGASSGLPVEKTASAVEVEKIAAQAAVDAVRGFIETQERIKVAAEQEYAQGYNDTMAQVEKVASDVYGQGFEDCRAVLASL